MRTRLVGTCHMRSRLMMTHIMTNCFMGACPMRSRLTRPMRIGHEECFHEDLNAGTPEMPELMA